MSSHRTPKAGRRSRGDTPERCEQNRQCVTCGDVAVLMRVLAVDEERCLALCEHESGSRETVEIALVLPVREGDELLVHAGTAIRHLGFASAAARRGRAR